MLTLGVVPSTVLASRGSVGLGFDLSLLGTVEFPTTVPSLDARIHLGIREFDPAWIVTGLGASYQLDDLMRGSSLDPMVHLYAGGGFHLDLHPEQSGSSPSLYLLLGLRYDLDRPLFTFVEATSYAGLAFGLGKSF